MRTEHKLKFITKTFQKLGFAQCDVIKYKHNIKQLQIITMNSVTNQCVPTQI